MITQRANLHYSPVGMRIKALYPVWSTYHVIRALYCFPLLRTAQQGCGHWVGNTSECLDRSFNSAFFCFLSYHWNESYICMLIFCQLCDYYSFVLVEEVVECWRSNFLPTYRVRRLLCHDQYWYEVVNLLLLLNLYFFCFEIVVSKERKPRKVKHDPNHDIILSTLFYTNLVSR